jgi:hypothetical protein
LIRIPQPNHDRDEPLFLFKGESTQPADSPLSVVSDSQPIRQGSPFAEGSANRGEALSGALAIPSSSVDQGPMQYTAVGALISCLVVLGFAIPSAIWFPAGGIVITALGLGLALFGIQSGRVKESLVLVATNLALFLYCVVSSQA